MTENKPGTEGTEAGAEMDRLIAERVMGWHIYHYDKGEKGSEYWSLLDENCNALVYSWRPGAYQSEFPSEGEAFGWFRPTENLGQAWQVIEELRAKKPNLYVSINSSMFDPGWVVWIDSKDNTARHESLPLAICRAALLALPL